MKKRTMLYALILSVMMIVSAFAVGCNNNDADTETVVAAANKTSELFKAESKYTISFSDDYSTGETADGSTLKIDMIIKCDGDKIAQITNESEFNVVKDFDYGNGYAYYTKEETDGGVKYYSYIAMAGGSISFGYVKMEITEAAYKSVNSLGTQLSEMLPLFSESKWVKGAEVDTYTSTISASGAEAKYTVKLSDGYLYEVKCKTTTASVAMVYFYKISDIGTTTVTIPENAQEITVPNVA